LHRIDQLLLRTAPLVLIAAVLVQASPAARQEAALPPARDVVARFVSALGGAEAYKAVKSARARGTMQIPSMQVTGTVEVMTARPARHLARVNINGIGPVEQGYDGKVGWSINPIAGPSLMVGRELIETADGAWFDGPLHEPDHVREMTTVARVTFDGKPAIKIKVVLVSGSEQFEYFDVETGLQIGMEADRATPQGVLPLTHIFRDYKKFGAVMQASTLVERAAGIETVLTLTSVEFDVVPDDTFAIPAQIKALIGKQ
jgi:hypothetical protein